MPSTLPDPLPQILKSRPDPDQVFEVPALLVDPPLEVQESVLSEATAGEVPELSHRVVRVHQSRGGLTLYFPSGRGGLGGLILLVFDGVFRGVRVRYHDQHRGGRCDRGAVVAFGVFSLMISGGFGVLMMLLGLYSLPNSLVVEIRNGKVTALRSFFLPFRHTARFKEFRKIDMDVHGCIGQGAKSSSHVRIRGIVHGGRRISLGDDVPLGRQSEILAALLEEVIGVLVETVKRSRRRVPA